MCRSRVNTSWRVTSQADEIPFICNIFVLIGRKIACFYHLSHFHPEIQVENCLFFPPHPKPANQWFLQMCGLLQTSLNLFLLLPSSPIICSTNILVPVAPPVCSSFFLVSSSLPPAASHLLNAPRWPSLRQLSGGSFQRSRCAGRMTGGALDRYDVSLCRELKYFCSLKYSKNEVKDAVQAGDWIKVKRNCCFNHIK